MRMKTFSDLSLELQMILRERFGRYNMDAEDMFDKSGVFSDEVKSLHDLDIINFMDKKDISHIYPRSHYPELTSEPKNVFLEDSAINQARGNDIVTSGELEMAFNDQIEDTFDFDIDEDGIIDLSGMSPDGGDSIDWENFELIDYLFG